MNAEDPRDQLLECADILVGAAEFAQAEKDYMEMYVAFADHYADAPRDGDTEEQIEADMAVLLELAPFPSFTHEELMTACWQLPELAIGLLMVFTEMVDEQTDRKKVGEIIRPQLYVPGA